jgi:iron-sulfur cluster assembly protein
VFVDRASLAAVDGTRIDFVRQGLNETFRFDNPNVQGECGCGESFTV